MKQSMIFQSALIFLLIVSTTTIQTADQNSTTHGSNPIPEWDAGQTALTLQSHNATMDNTWLFEEAQYLGSKLYESFESVAVDSKGNVYAVGIVEGSSIANQLKGVPYSTYGGSYDALIVKFNATASVQWTRYLGGNRSDYITDIAIDSHDNLIVVGVTSSKDFPLVSPQDSVFGNGTDPEGLFLFNIDGFVANISSEGVIQHSTYFGGFYDVMINGVELDNEGNVLIIGSSRGDIGQTIEFGTGSLTNGFVAKLTATTLKSQWVTVFKANGIGGIYSIAIDLNESIVVAGSSYGEFPFPSMGPYTSNSGESDVFIAKLIPYSGEVYWGNYFGGTGSDYWPHIDIASDGRLFMAFTTSSESLVVNGELITAFHGRTDIFVVEFSPSAYTLSGNYVGSIGSDTATDLVLDDNDNAYFSGVYNSTSTPRQETESGIFGNYSRTGLRYSFVSGAINRTAINGLAVSGSTVYTVGFSNSLQTLYARNILSYEKRGIDAFIKVTDMATLRTEYSNRIVSAGEEIVTDMVYNPLRNKMSFTGYTDNQYTLYGDRRWTVYLLESISNTQGFIGGSMEGNRYLQNFDSFDGTEYANSVTIDSFGNVIVVGSTTDTITLPETARPGDSNSGGKDILIVKFDPSNRFSWARVIGGSDDDVALDVEVDYLGNIYIGGYTKSSDFPIYPDNRTGASPPLQGDVKGVIMKLSYDGDILQSAFVEGKKSSYSVVQDIAVDNMNVHAILQYADEQFQMLNDIIRYDTSLYIESVYSISDPSYNFYSSEVAPDGAVVLAGNTVTLNGDTDFTVWKIYRNYTVSMIQLGSGGDDSLNAASLDIDSTGNILVSGYTSSTDLPITNGYQSHNMGDYDGYVMKLNPSLDVMWSTYYGGSDQDIIRSAQFGSNGRIYIVGITQSSNLPRLPRSNQYTGGVDSFLVVFHEPTYDTDGDLIPNLEEIARGLDPLNNDTDGDGVPDGVEDMLGTDPFDSSDGDIDSDGDGMPNNWEVEYGLNPSDPTDGSIDSDGDGLDNSEEYNYSTNPTHYDTDGDGVSDGAEIDWGTDPLNPQDGNIDSDGDGMPNDYEYLMGFNGSDPSDGMDDPDRDGLTNAEEYKYGTDPFNSDTDGDGYGDHEEIEAGSDPLDTLSVPKKPTSSDDNQQTSENGQTSEDNKSTDGEESDPNKDQTPSIQLPFTGWVFSILIIGLLRRHKINVD